jgi:hypothetical protein
MADFFKVWPFQDWDSGDLERCMSGLTVNKAGF